MVWRREKGEGEGEGILPYTLLSTFTTLYLIPYTYRSYTLYLIIYLIII